MPFENLGELRRVVPEMLEHRAVLDEGNRLPSSFIDIMMLRPAVRISVIADCSLGSSTSTTPPRGAPVARVVTEIADHLVEPQQPAEVLLGIVLGELDEQDGLRVAAHDRVDGRLEHGDLARQAEHGAVDETRPRSARA